MIVEEAVTETLEEEKLDCQESATTVIDSPPQQQQQRIETSTKDKEETHHSSITKVEENDDERGKDGKPKYLLEAKQRWSQPDAG